MKDFTFNPSEGWSLSGSTKARKRGKFRALGPVSGAAKPAAPKGAELLVAGVGELARAAAAPPAAPKSDPAENATAAFLREVRYARGRYGEAELTRIGARARDAGVDPHLVRALATKPPASDIARRAESRLVYAATKDSDLAATFGRPRSDDKWPSRSRRSRRSRLRS